jgi:hypothetical protein
MLRVTFNCTNETTFQAVIRSLAVVAEHSQRSAKEAFSIYNVNTLQSEAGSLGSLGVEIVEIHNEEDSIFSSSLDTVRALLRAFTSCAAYVATLHSAHSKPLQLRGSFTVYVGDSVTRKCNRA